MKSGYSTVNRSRYRNRTIWLPPYRSVPCRTIPYRVFPARFSCFGTRVPWHYREKFMTSLTSNASLTIPSIHTHPCRGATNAIHRRGGRKAEEEEGGEGGCDGAEGVATTVVDAGGVQGWLDDVIAKVKSAMPEPTEAKKLLPLGLMLFFILFDYTILRDTKVLFCLLF